MEIQEGECRMRKFLAVPLLFTVFVLVACDAAKPSGKIDNIVRVFMNDPGNRYTFVVQREDYLKEITIYIRPAGEQDAVTYVRDVPIGQKMWAELTEMGNFSNGVVVGNTVKIHIHEESDIEGGGWSHGKLGRGTTVVVQ